MIRFATPADTSKIMKFIDDYWKKNHILARDEKFFRYFFQDDDKLNVVISENDNVVNAMLGFVPYGKNNRDIMNCVWKVHRDNDPFLGMKLLDYLYKNADVRIMASPGINTRTIPLYKYLDYPTGKMKHWYRLNNETNYNIAVIQDKFIPSLENLSVRWKEFSTFDEMTRAMDMEKYKANNPKPYKENWYIKHRYFDHPIYHYHAFGVVQSDESVNAVFFYRVQEYNNFRAIRLVDCIGDYNEFAQIGAIVDELLKRHNAEYLDLYETGLNDKLLVQAGLLNVEETSNIIPDYFAPYEAKNVDIYYFSTDADIVLFKGDGDQDRPN